MRQLSSSLIRRLVLPLVIMILLLVQVFPLLSVAQTASTPVSQSITFISFNGEDSDGVLAFEHGQIAFYAYALPPSEYTSLPSGVKVYLVPATFYDVLVNPLNTTFGFNPFQFQQVRFALNFIVNRQYFVDQILKGNGIPAISVYAGEPDVLHLLPTLSKYSYIHYNFTYANETIYKVLTAHGAQYINGTWYYHGKPIVVYVFVRTDTTVRYEYAKYFISQLEKLGFQVQVITGNLQKQESFIYGSDPANTTWEIAFEAWGGVYSYYDAGLAVGLYSTLGAVAPFSSYYGLSMGAFNDTKYMSPELLKEANQIDRWSLMLATSNFSSEQEYYELENNITNLGIQMAVRISLGISLAPIYVLPNINGVYPSFAQGSLLSFQTYMMIANGSYPNVTIGVRYLSQGAANPGAGFQDAYTDEIAVALFAPQVLTVPGSGYPIPYIYTYKIVNMSPKAIVPVPTDALWWNPAKQEITTVPPNTTAQMAVIYNFAPLFNNDKWADGMNITLADIIYQYIVAAEMSLNSSNPIYDPTASSAYGPALQDIKGFKIINSTAIEIWGNAWFFDPNYAAASLINDFNPLGFALSGQAGYFPWQLYVAMKQLVAEGKAAWSSAEAQSKGVDWLSLVNPTDVNNILSLLKNDSATAYIPQSLIQVEKLSNFTLVTPQEAVAGYNAAISFIEKYGNAMIGDGPYILVAWNPSASPAYAKIVRSPYFHIPMPSKAIILPSIFTISLTVPPTVSPGTTLTGTVVATPEGSTTSQPASNVTVVVTLLSSNGTIINVTTLTTNSSGRFTYTFPSKLEPGTYTLSIVAYQPTSILLNPVSYSVVVVPPVTTTTTPTVTTTTPSVTTSTPTTPTTTTSGVSVGLIAGIVIVLIIIIVAVILLMRRR